VAAEEDVSDEQVTVTYMELRAAPAPPPVHAGSERIAVEHPCIDEYLALYRRVGERWRWNQRLQMTREALSALLESTQLRIYVLRDAAGGALGFCEFDRSGYPEIELTNFGLVPDAIGRGLGPWLLAHALHAEWQVRPARIWLHTDTWDHPAAVGVYERAGFVPFDVRRQAAGSL
jgi:GNAT superfamily N-acetyltransferase